jgi:DNA-binding FadR family transcriptional regulator
MPLQTIEPRRLYRQIADQLRALIVGGEFPVGSRLPAERELAAKLGVSRPSVREALIALEVEGLVEVRVGSGIHVLAREPGPSARRVENAFGPFEIIRARQVVEGELAAMAARTMGRAQVHALQETLVVMESEMRAGRIPIEGDRLFHTRIAEAAENAPLMHVVGELFDERNNPLFAQLGHYFENETNWECAVDEHRAVVEAIAAHAPQRARAAMHDHLQRSHDRFAVAWPEPAERAEPITRLAWKAAAR